MAGKAKMLISATYNGLPTQFMIDGKLADVYEFDMTDDLPQDAMGEAMQCAMEAMWKSGYDPTTLLINVQFE